MQRLATFVLAASLLALAIALVTGGRVHPGPTASAWPAVTPEAAAPTDPILVLPDATSLLGDTDLILPLPDSSATADASAADRNTESNLPPGAPRTVTFGVLLVVYAGAQGAGPGARSKAEALTLAEKLAKLGAKDFPSAVKLADVGFEDAGEIQRGVLEGGPEVVLFELPPGGIGGPVDSPRGYYVFKRIE